MTFCQSISHVTETAERETCVLDVIIIQSVMCWYFYSEALCTAAAWHKGSSVCGTAWRSPETTCSQ